MSSISGSRSTVNAGIFGAMAGAGMLGFLTFPDSKEEAKLASNTKLTSTTKVEAKTLYSLEDIKTMCAAGRIVVAYKGEVFDVTEFTGHPGGVGRLQMAAGGDLEVYWKVYTQHNRGHIVEKVMAPYKIGVVSKEDMQTITSNTFYDESAYEDDPKPYPDLLVNTRYPYNAEARLGTLTDNWLTPIGKHFVRNHSSVPVIDPEEYRLTVNGGV